MLLLQNKVTMSKPFVFRIHLEEHTPLLLKVVLMLQRIIREMVILSTDFFTIQKKVVIIDLENLMCTD